MSDHYLTDRIVVARDVFHSKPCVVGTRIMVYLVLDLLAGSLSSATIIKVS